VLISAALIVKNEQERLGRCLSSIRDVVDEIVIVDTGSTDDTVAIAESFGAVVLHRPWDGNFSAARNCALDAVRAPTVLYIDADEYLEFGTRAAIETALNGPGDHVAWRLSFTQRPGFTPYMEYRVWRNRPDLRFHGVIHESVVPAIDTVCLTEGKTVGILDWRLQHDGYEGDQSVKHARNLPLLQAQLVDSPDRTYLWDHIGRIHDDRGETDEARSAYNKGLEIIRRKGLQDPSDSLIYADLILSNAVTHRPDAPLVAEAVGLLPRNTVIRWSCALDALSRRAWDEVITHIDAVLDVPVEEMSYQGLGMNAKITSEWAYHVRGMARFQLGEYAAAAQDFATAEASSPGAIAYRAKRILAQARSRRWSSPSSAN
jgi:glycosyltransferase involved in cell wall biosynthesis